MSYSRFIKLLKNLQNNSIILLQYVKTINSEIKKGIIEEVKDIDRNIPSHHIPHRHIIKPNHITTKLRIVYDVSKKQAIN